MTAKMKQSLSVLVSYPLLIPHEEALTKSPYDVGGWYLYLEEIDAILEALCQAQGGGMGAVNSSSASSAAVSSSSAGRVKSKQSKSKKQQASRKPIQAGGRTTPPTSIKASIRSLSTARNQVSERALSLLPGSYKLWRSYLTFRTQIQMAPSSSDDNYVITSSPTHRRYLSTISAFERSLVRMNKYPRIWLSYLTFLIQNDPTCSVTNVRRLFDRALLALPASQHDLIWNEYLAWVTGTLPPGVERKPRNQLGPVCALIKAGGLKLSTPDYPLKIPAETVLRVVRRYAHRFDPTARELLSNLCLTHHRYGEAATLTVAMLDDPSFLSPYGTTRHDMWLKLSEICIDHPDEIRKAGVDFDGIVRAALGRDGAATAWEVFDHLQVREEVGGGVAGDPAAAGKDGADKDGTHDDNVKEADRTRSDADRHRKLQATLGEMEGTLWTKLAEYRVRSGEFELARSVYEEAMENVSRVRDFSLVFDAYMKFEEGVVEAMMELMQEDEEDEEGVGGAEGETKGERGSDDGADDEDLDILLGDAAANRSSNQGQQDDDQENTSNADVELALARAENLMSRRPLLLNRVLLRQNPHNVGEWTKRSLLYLRLDQTRQAVGALEEAVTTVKAKHAVNGSPATLYTSLSALHEDTLKDVNSARTVYERVCRDVEYAFRDADDLAQCWAAWAELELRVENWDGALSVARQSVANPELDKRTRVTRGLVRSLRLWNLLLDLEESLGTVQTTKDAYNRALEVKVATPSHVLNYATFLTDKKYFEESFTAYERGVDLFPFPHPGAKLIWKSYLESFLERYEGTKIPRSRELFDRCLESCPAEQSSDFFLMYGGFEEKFGLTKRALSVYERMCTTVPPEEKFTAYQLYLTKTVQYLGVTATRPIYERAIAALEDAPAAQMCLDFSVMEKKLGELDRARTVLTFGAQLADPRRNPEYWKGWHDFEVSHGNEETFREMLRVKRGVQAAFSTVNYNAAEMGAGVPKVETLTDDRALEEIAAREGVNVNAKPRIGGFVQGKRTAEIKDLDEVERRAAKIAKRIEGSGVDARAGGGGDGDEIDIDDDDSEDEDEDGGGGKQPSALVQDVETKAVPAAVFGGLAGAPKDSEGA